jgi:hypothetical protein
MRIVGIVALSLVGLVVLLLLMLVLRSVPDIKRYVKIRSM